ncbi:hypothetical protein C4G81_RS22065 [Vibrio parahaemolyticus]|uniref:hypothetical protein n=1 Tax=Vibrio diabolicus TaxID=50719 RepID=UPI00215F5916|nr:hypothetical protein [Vibrio diabolicus]EJG0692311.1 hypothetical protein [Vibrio parahaemolyticus]MCS0436348.1 hypothetical protein [Vibrio diabolicus]
MKEIIEKSAEKARELASVFESNGYQVFIEPTFEEMPIDLGSYRPDLLAIKDKQGVVVEIKASLKRLPLKKFNEISKRVSSNKGWKFALVTLDDDVNNVLSIANFQLPDGEELKKKLGDIEKLIEMEMLPNALVFLWVQIESWLRIKVELSGENLNLLQPKRLINYLYTDGELSMEQVDSLNELLQLRHMVVHGFDATVTKAQLEVGKQILQDLIESTK